MPAKAAIRRMGTLFMGPRLGGKDEAGLVPAKSFDSGGPFLLGAVVPHSSAVG